MPPARGWTTIASRRPASPTMQQRCSPPRRRRGGGGGDRPCRPASRMHAGYRRGQAHRHGQCGGRRVGGLAWRGAARAGVVYSLAYGDQPALICEQVDWARACGFRWSPRARAPNICRIPRVHPGERVGPLRADARTGARGGMNPQMFNSFLDGTKSGIEMAAVANATGLDAAADGLAFPPCGTTNWPMCCARAPGSSGRAGRGHLFPGSRRPAGVQRSALGRLRRVRGTERLRGALLQGIRRGDRWPGRYAAMYRPFHLIGLELNVSVLSAALRGEPTGAPAAVATLWPPRSAT